MNNETAITAQGYFKSCRFKEVWLQNAESFWGIGEVWE